ncbi:MULTISPECIES: class I adenylate-forming enzyme family protein [Idiomarina]|uniref:class I adenylate-forming enzyme family protein n=1 Tax=Idiomarinaceae TaxID=267893 RepID=UPI00129B92E0|nr:MULTISPECIES: AMP-binding protein [Idiomarina]MRJ40671.1 AMP-binding protein [Idiomarina sp. FeN1]NCU58607.1 AMP-binding protein [Idiomarina sp. FenA--70]NCU61304.1 AMP-binding protein [Idiomarina sp. FenBw--71]UUN14639.1 AMP-binding protein [Idiomarina loihiensis]
MIIPAYVARNARKYPNQEAVIDGQLRATWQQLDNDVDRCARYLVCQHQISAGDRVCLVLPNTYTFVVAYFAIQRIGAIVAPINVKLTASELNYIFTDADARLVITCDLTSTHALAACRDLGINSLVINQMPEFLASQPIAHTLPPGPSDSAQDPLQPLATDAVLTAATLLYTSGTTGRPKGVLFHHQALLFVGMMFATEMHYGPDSRLLSLMPFTHSAPLNLTLVGGTIMGSTHVIAPTFTPELLLQLVAQERTTHFFGAPVAYLMTAQHPAIKTADLTSMSHWIYGGGPLAAEHAKQVQEAFGSDQFYCVYGLTEAGPTGSFLRPEEHASKAGSVGRRAAAFTEMRIINSDGKIAAVNEPGEIHIGGEGLMQEYWRNPSATAEVFTSDGWIRTGDIGIRDQDGYFWVKDRIKDLIICGGVNVYPREVEDALARHPAVLEAAVIGIPHPQWGETVKACVVLKANATEADLRAHMSNCLADYKCPRIYAVMDELPHNANGKVLKHQLR